MCEGFVHNQTNLLGVQLLVILNDPNVCKVLNVCDLLQLKIVALYLFVKNRKPQLVRVLDWE